MSNLLRNVVFVPYVSHRAPKFHLFMTQGPCGIEYRLVMQQRGVTTVLFEGNDFRPSLRTSPNSNEAVRSLMSFLTLKPGDTDSEYFDNYNSKQLQFAQRHAEALSACVEDTLQS